MRGHLCSNHSLFIIRRLSLFLLLILVADYRFSLYLLPGLPYLLDLLLVYVSLLQLLNVHLLGHSDLLDRKSVV